MSTLPAWRELEARAERMRAAHLRRHFAAVSNNAEGVAQYRRFKGEGG